MHANFLLKNKSTLYTFCFNCNRIFLIRKTGFNRIIEGYCYTIYYNILNNDKRMIA